MNRQEQRELKRLKQAQKEGHLVNVAWSGGLPKWRLLSNFAPTPFELKGREYASVESFWQSLKFPAHSNKRQQIRQMSPAWKAKQAGREQGWPEWLQYQGREYRSASPAHHQLADRAIRAKVDQHPQVRKRLLETGNRKIVHVVVNQKGEISRDSYSLPRAVFAQLLTDIRAELQRENFNPYPELPDPGKQARQASLL